MNSSQTHPAVDCAAIATQLARAWETRSFIPAPSRTHPTLSKGDALDIAERVRALRIAAGDVPVGYKVGFTNAAVRAQFDAAGPLAAPVYDRTLLSAARVEAGALLGPRIEPEVVIGIAADGSVGWAALGFEIVQSHVAGWEFGYLDAIADFGLHAGLIVGERRAIGGETAWLTAMQVRLLRDGRAVAYGAAADVDGGALGSLRWLRGDLQRTGRALRAGELVSTGSMTTVPEIAAGQRWTIEAIGAELAPLTIEVD
jgi:2-oxo-3-hexenedioate decarboxylase